jgi:tRNA U34 5-methylaminomethyl-2-thiouridine-forming methyltransferase MnmC
MRDCAEEFVIWDVGLGAAANALTALRSTSDVSARVRLISFDRTTAALEFALRYARELGFVARFESQVEELLAKGSVSFWNERQQVEWKMIIHDFPATMASPDPRFPAPHAIFFDAFSPARNPEMWSLPVLTNVFSRLNPARACSLATFSRSTISRTALLLAGFFVGRGEALAGKEETTVAANRRELIRDLLDQAWLDRARRSHSAEPLHGDAYVQQALTPESWEHLRRHPQFT